MTRKADTDEGVVDTWRVAAGLGLHLDTDVITQLVRTIPKIQYTHTAMSRV